MGEALLGDGRDVGRAVVDGEQAVLALDPSAGAVLATDGGTYDAALVSVPTSAGEVVDDLRTDLEADAQPLADAGLDVDLASEGLLVDLVLSELQSSQIRGLVITLVGSAATTMAGFGMLVFSTISPFRQFGVVLALTIGLALLSSIIVLPAMLALWARRHEPERVVPSTPATADPATTSA